MWLSMHNYVFDGLLSALGAPQIKPDGVQRGLVGEIIGRLERKGFTLRALRLRSVPRQLAEEHYKDLRERPFFLDLVDYITSGPVVAMVRAGVWHPSCRACALPAWC